MEVFIGNLPGETILTELKEFLGVTELKADFHFFKGRDAKANSYHFLVARTATQEEGLELISRLNGREYGGRRIVARPYIKRRSRPSWHQPERRINPGLR